MTLKDFLTEVKRDSRVEGELIKTILYSLVVSSLVFGLLYFFRFQYIEGFMADYGLFSFLAILSTALVVPAIRQVRAYKEFACMSGMMIGMTVGMVSGFLFGYWIGATNGMFWGSVFGMAVGIALGVWMGSCCGVMGFMEGTMAGFMGGLMGAMTAVMMYNDHLRAAAVIVFIVCAVIMLGLNYMVFFEMKEFDRLHREDHSLTYILSFVLTTATLWMMLYGPKSPLFGG